MADPSPKIRILIADDQVLFARMLKTVLESHSEDFEVVAMTLDGVQTLEAVKELRPDLVLMDLRMPVMDGLETIRTLRKHGDNTKVIVLTTFKGDSAIKKTLDLSISGYVLKDCEPEELFSAVKAVHAGMTSLSPEVLSRLASDRGRESVVGEPDLESPIPEIDRKDRELLRLVAEGFDNREIASQLYLAEQTIKNRISHFYTRFDIHDRTKLVKFAERVLAARKSTETVRD